MDIASNRIQLLYWVFFHDFLQISCESTLFPHIISIHQCSTFCMNWVHAIARLLATFAQHACIQLQIISLRSPGLYWLHIYFQKPHLCVVHLVILVARFDNELDVAIADFVLHILFVLRKLSAIASLQGDSYKLEMLTMILVYWIGLCISWNYAFIIHCVLDNGFSFSSSAPESLHPDFI